MLSALVLQSIGLYLFVATYYVNNADIIISISVIARLINGFV